MICTGTIHVSLFIFMEFSTFFNRNHFFDEKLTNKKRKRRDDIIVNSMNSPMHGCKSIRQHYKVDESKLLPTDRIGIKMYVNLFNLKYKISNLLYWLPMENMLTSFKIINMITRSLNFLSFIS